jgi:hypothetical protein
MPEVLVFPQGSPTNFPSSFGRIYISWPFITKQQGMSEELDQFADLDFKTLV